MALTIKDNELNLLSLLTGLPNIPVWKLQNPASSGPLKRWYPTSLHSITTQEIMTWTYLIYASRCPTTFNFSGLCAFKIMNQNLLTKTVIISYEAFANYRFKVSGPLQNATIWILIYINCNCGSGRVHEVKHPLQHTLKEGPFCILTPQKYGSFIHMPATSYQFKATNLFCRCVIWLFDYVHFV